jgi:hypothetical protein
MANDADSHNPSGLPKTYGNRCNFIFTSIYSHYIDHTTGFMSFKKLVQFIEDSDIIKTHVPLDTGKVKCKVYSYLCYIF